MSKSEVEEQEQEELSLHRVLRNINKVEHPDPYIEFHEDVIKYIPGERGNRVILTVSHGAEKGKDSPRKIRVRQEGIGVNFETAVGVKVLGELLAEKIKRLTGSRPYVIYLNLHRSKVDVNLELLRSHNCDGSQFCVGCKIWKKWHACIDMAKEAIAQNGSRGLLLDLNSSSHKDMLVSLGFGLTKLHGWEDMGPSYTFQVSSSISKLLEGAGRNWEEYVIGKKSLGTLLLKQMHRGMEFNDPRVVPSCEERSGDIGYILGGYNIRRHGSMGTNYSSFDAIQIDTPACLRIAQKGEPDKIFTRRRNAYVRALATAIVEFAKNYN